MTGDVEEAGTDDNVNVQMNNLDKVYYLNSSRDDFYPKLREQLLYHQSEY